MVKLPRDLSGEELEKKLSKLGYSFLRRESSHVVLKPPTVHELNLCIPDHHPLKVGMLSRILSIVSQQTGLEVQEIIRKLKL